MESYSRLSFGFGFFQLAHSFGPSTEAVEGFELAFVHGMRKGVQLHCFSSGYPGRSAFELTR